jgi:biotin-(acetyl-CoA carboxylase) ligase
MARPTKKTVYIRIEEKIEEIQKTEELLTTLNKELKELYAEKDNLEMHQLLSMMKENNLTIDKAMTLLQSNKK